MASSILVNQLVVVGRRKNYNVDFNPGVNIIYGDSATGKSTIVNLIDYLLGAKSFDTYTEIESAALYAALDVTLNEDRYTIKRDIFNDKSLIEVYKCPFDKTEQYPVKKYLPNFDRPTSSSDDGYFSDFLLDALNLHKIKLKNSPTKDISGLSRLSFRDIFKFCYVDQDDLGHKSFLNSENYSKAIKNKEVFKYIFNALDSNISEISDLISQKSSRKIQLEKKYELVSEFLRESGFNSVISMDLDLENIDLEMEELKKNVEELNKEQIADDEIYEAIKSQLSSISLKKKAATQNLMELEIKIERFSRLRNDYLNDINKFKASVEAQKSIGNVKKTIEICPVCDNSLDIDVAKSKFDISESDRLLQEISALKRRVREVEQIVSDSRVEWSSIKSEIKKLESVEKEAIEYQELNTKQLPSNYLLERDFYVRKLGELKQKKEDLTAKLKVRNQHGTLIKEIESISSTIQNLKEQLEKLQEKSPSLSEAFSSMADNIKDYLEFVKIKDPNGISYNEKTFLPKVRDVDYEKITSGGLRTIVSIGHLCSLMLESLNRPMNYPSFLIIDTVGKYLGKTKEQNYKDQLTDMEADSKEAISDPNKYQNIFEYIINLSNLFEGKNRTCQFILVDNDVPSHIVDKLQGFIVAQYNPERINGHPIGFIDDADAPISSN